MVRWQFDGWDVKARIGVLTPYADVGPESEFNAMAPTDVAIHAARVPFGAMAPGGKMDPTIPLAPVRAFAEPPHIDDAAASLAAAPIDAIAFGFTSSAYVIGAEAEKAMIARLQHRTRGIPIVATCAAAVDALQLLNCQRIALIDPPWFDTQLNNLGRRYYETAGFEVVYAAPADLPSDQKAINPADLHAYIFSHTPEDADAVVIGGNGFRAVGIISALEADLKLPVLTANQVLFWAALKAVGIETNKVTKYGKIFLAADDVPEPLLLSHNRRRANK